MRVMNIAALPLLLTLGTAAAATPDLPEPELLLHVDLSPFAPEDAYFRGSSAHFGDLDNDGDPRDFIRHVNSNRMQAFRFTGDGVELLWDYEAGFDLPLPSERYFYKYVIWDLDGDGRSEVAGAFATQDGQMEMRVLDAASGEIRHAAPLPIANPHSDHRNRALRMKVVVADLAGDGNPSELLLVDERNSDGDIHAFTADLAPLWDTRDDHSSIIPAHYPWAFDLDGDGRDEVVGRFILSPDGTEIVRLTPEEWVGRGDHYEHIDRAILADILPDRPGLELAISYEWLHVAVVDPITGEDIWRSEGVHRDAKLLAVGEFVPESPGLEMIVEWALTDDEKESVILSANGEELRRGEKTFSSGYAMDWDGARETDEVFETKYGLIAVPATGAVLEIRDTYREDANSRHADDMRVYMHALDLVGDYREEVIVFDENEMLVYGAAGEAPAELDSPWNDPQYRLAVANQMSDNHSERQFFDWRTVGDAVSAASQ